MSHMRLTDTADLFSKRGYSWNETQLRVVKFCGATWYL